ncbi:MAG: iron ABC transporter substrate-binding protein [SAR202 cluster bacterium]|nr:iron ABC transporter substrate-binding protein [SAR202 cluster bacterium]
MSLSKPGLPAWFTRARLPLLLLTLFASLALGAVACGEDSTPTRTTQPAATGSPVASPSPTNTPVASSRTLTIYSGRAESLVDPIIKQFSQATGIKVEVKYAGTPQLAATLLEEGRNSPADVFYAQDPGGLGSVEELLAPLPQSVVNLAPEWARSPDGKWIGVSGRARVVVYNTSKLKESDLPEDIYNFVDPKWKGRIGFAPTNASLQTMITGMRSLWGEAKTKQWLEGIKANDFKTYNNNSSVVDAVSKGEIDVGFVNHYYLYQFLSERGESFPARNYHTKAGGPGALVMVSGAGILNTSKNKEAAQKFLEFMLSPVAQQYFASKTYEYPLVEGISVNRLLTPIDQINQPNITMKQLADLEGTQKIMREAGILP